MEQRITKILNILKKFQINEIATYLECEESEIKPYINNLISEGFVKKISESEYVYIINKDSDFQRKINQKTIEVSVGFNMKKNEIFNLENYKDFPAETVFKRKTDLDYYNKCDERTKKLIIKHIVLFNIAGNMPFGALKQYLKKISEKYPEYTMNAQWYRRKYNRYLKEGLAGLYYNKISTIDSKTYNEFKKLYLNPCGYTQEQCYNMLLLKSGYKEGDIPTLPTFVHRLKHEYTPDAIKKMRSYKIKPPTSADVEYLKIHKKRKRPSEVYFEKAANDYIQSLIENQIGVSKTIKLNIKRIIAHFRGIKLGDIVKEKVLEFREKLLSEGTTINTVKNLIGTLFTILKASGIEVEYEIHEYLKKSNKVFSIEDITTIISSHNTPETFIIALGLRLGELQALKYEDFDFENKLVTIKRRNECGRIKEFKHAKYIRQCRVPQIILNQIDKNKKGFIFGKITMPTYESCLYAYIMLMQKQHVPMNIIASSMGHTSVSSFYQIYYHLFPKHLEENFDIFKNLKLEENK